MTSSSNIFFGITNLSAGILFIVISLPLMTRKIPMNSLYGFRMEKALSSDENWYRINAYGGRQLAFWSLFLVGIGILNLFYDQTDTQNIFEVLLYAAGPTLICVLVTFFKTLIYAKTLD